MSSECVLRAYFIAAASIFDPNRANERLGWAHTAVLAKAVSLHLEHSADADSVRESFADKLSKCHCNNIERFVFVSLQAGTKIIVNFFCTGDDDAWIF